MNSDDLSQRDLLEDFERRAVTVMNKRKQVFVGGNGPAVIVMAELPGITPYVARFARWVRDAGFTVYMPNLFGDAGAPGGSVTTTVRAVVQICVSREFHLLRSHSSGPIADWLRGLAALALGEAGGKGVGAVGRDELRAVRERLDSDDLTVRAYRFRGDRICRAQRFTAYQAALGDRFVPTVIEDEHAREDTSKPKRHSVLTRHLIDADGEPTRQAVDDIIDFFAARLT
jgi:hypothetical protein